MVYTYNTFALRGAAITRASAAVSTHPPLKETHLLPCFFFCNVQKAAKVLRVLDGLQVAVNDIRHAGGATG